MDKNTLRKQLLEKRKLIANKQEKSAKLVSIALNYIGNSNIIALYYPLKDEVNTILLIEYLLSQNKKVCLPKVEKDFINFYYVSSLEELVKSSKFNLVEPVGEASKLVDSKLIEIIFCPGVGFDKENNRLGFGKGYYDKYLKNVNCLKIGLAYKEQVVDKLPVNDFDIKMDLVVTI